MVLESSASSPLPLAVQALRACLKKCGAMDTVNRDRLCRRLDEAGVTDLAGIRRFLRDGGMPPAVGGFLLAMLPPQDDLVIGGCHLLVHLADGGMGTVWLAEYQGELAVIKTLKRELAEDQVYLKRFDRESTITANLDHPHVVRCLGHGTDAGVAWLRLEFVAGGDLANLIVHRGRLDDVHALTILLQTTRGLEHAWKQSLVHRDIKPANLFIDLKGRVKVADFGLARSIDSEAMVLTGPGMTLGSPAYMAPELIRAKALDCRTDIYACGIVLYECLAGEVPFTGTQAETIFAHINTPPPDIRKINPRVGGATAQIINKCLAKEPDQRFASPLEMIYTLTAALWNLGSDPDAALPRDIIKASTAVMPAIVIEEPLPKRGGPASATEKAVKRPRLGSASGENAVPSGDFASALASPRLTLAAGDLLLVLLAQDTVVCGKMLTAPVDIPLRDYPAEQQVHSCSRVSRQHFEIRAGAHATISDLGSTNGTLVDGVPLVGDEARALVANKEHHVAISESVELTVRAIPRRGDTPTALPDFPPATHPPGPGLASPSAWDAIVIRRTVNRPTLCYALVPRRITVGPPTADLPIAGWRGTGFELAHWNAHWIWRRGQEPWKGLAPGLLFGMTVREGQRDDCR